jgi:hypothetical protein
VSTRRTLPDVAVKFSLVSQPQWRSHDKVGPALTTGTVTIRSWFAISWRRTLPNVIQDHLNLLTMVFVAPDCAECFSFNDKSNLVEFEDEFAFLPEVRRWGKCTGPTLTYMLQAQW